MLFTVLFWNPFWPITDQDFPTLSILEFYLRMEIPFWNCCDGFSINAVNRTQCAKGRPLIIGGGGWRGPNWNNILIQSIMTTTLNCCGKTFTNLPRSGPLFANFTEWFPHSPEVTRDLRLLRLPTILNTLCLASHCQPLLNGLTSNF